MLLLVLYSLIGAFAPQNLGEPAAPVEAPSVVVAPNPWANLIDSRIQRRTALLEPSVWTAERRSGLAMQEYLMTLGQNGEPGSAAVIAGFFSDPVLQGSALFAYGELMNAPINPLLEMTARPENLVLYAEALSKLVPPDDNEIISTVWDQFPEDIKNRSLFFFWRNKTETLTRKVLAALKAPKAEQSGYVYYLYRSRTPVAPVLLVKLLDVMKRNPQGLIHTTRIAFSETSPDLETRLEELCVDSDWRIRVNGLKALGQTGNTALIEKWGMKAITDPNPNVIRTALEMLVDLGNDKIDKKLASYHDVLSDSNIFTLAARADKDRSGRFIRLIKSWEKSDDSWHRARWLDVVGKMGPSEALDKKLTKMLNGWRWEQGTAGQKSQALRTLIQRNPSLGREEIKRAFESGDPYLMSVATGALNNMKDQMPVSLDLLHQASSRFYVTTDFHQAYLGLMGSVIPEDQFAQHLTRLRKHPDYLVRLRALQATPNPSDGERQAIFERGWRHRIHQNITEPAAGMLSGQGGVRHWQLETTKGLVTIKLQVDYAPITSANIIHLTEQGYFDNMPIHRVVPNFVVQAGDNRGDGSGGPGYNIPCEINPLRFRKGAVGMALSGKDTGGGQFFICHSDQPHLDGGYTVFGHVIKGMGIVTRLEEGNRIVKARVIESK